MGNRSTDGVSSNTMKRADRNALVAFPLVVMIGCGIAVAGSQGGASVHGIPVFALSVGLVFLIQWLAFLPAYLLQSEAFFDITGSVTYIAVTAIAVLLGPVADGRSILLAALVVIWAARLGAYLFRRIRKAGRDARFDEIKPSFVRFLDAWTVQGLWVSLTLAAALAAITTTVRKDLGVVALLGSLVWAAGFAIEAAADVQKSRFRADPANRGRFIHSGLWSWSRHPNYFGEIVLWIGVALIALPVLRGWQWVTLISPLFVILLLTCVSGVPLLEKKANATWGGQDDYEAYKARTAVLVPLPSAITSGKGR
jgi:steroid 5-alpha reductase family enzyme